MLAVRDNARAHGTSRAVVALEGDCRRPCWRRLPSTPWVRAMWSAWCWDATTSLRPAQEEAEAARCAAVRAIAERLHIRTVERDAPDAARVLDRDVSAAMPSACALARWASCWRIRRSSWVRWC
ncbi:MAG: hypothetical protein ACLU0O_01470 [Collinsella sp.]